MLRQDYILVLLEEMRRFVAEVVNLRTQGRHSEAFLRLVQAQEKLFARPLEQIAALTLSEQLDTLALQETPSGAVKKFRAYAMLLVETGRLYQQLGKPDAAHNAYAAALTLLLEADLRFPGEERVSIADAIRELLPEIDPTQLHAPTRELLDRFIAAA